MLDFRTPTLKDREIIESLAAKSGQTGCDVTFANTYLWRRHYDIRVAFSYYAYYKCYYTNGVLTGYTMPIATGDIKSAVDELIYDARSKGIMPVIGLLNEQNAAILRELYPRKFRITPSRDSFDYIYERSDLAELSGKKYHAKRNHISRFFRTYDDICTEEICKNNFADVMSVAERWQNGGEDTGELEIIRDALDHFDELGLFGLLLYVDGRPVAMTIASRLNDEMCDVHFEKAVEIDEAYAVINNEFAKRYTDFRYINREEDLGLEGLRKSKLSYYPSVLLKKSTAVYTY